MNPYYFIFEFFHQLYFKYEHDLHKTSTRIAFSAVLMLHSMFLVFLSFRLLTGVSGRELGERGFDPLLVTIVFLSFSFFFTWVYFTPNTVRKIHEKYEGRKVLTFRNGVFIGISLLIPMCIFFMGF